ncbi:CD209 antigen-like protein E isoform X2 [Mastacembelus armatus]|uniref:CD209 antigen-like protein E isoform X2 n=1 Tax=Mastacembelus armatus TaxID=205130 RepID=UPI000E4581E6|nr:CD209 antigen-like protein E isoform X2 [Mastacembelus armatus]
MFLNHTEQETQQQHLDLHSLTEFTILVHRFYCSIAASQHSVGTESEVYLLISCLSPLKMSSNKNAKPDVSRKVRHNKREVQIYKNADNIRDDPTGFRSEEGGPHSQNHPPVQRKPLRGAAVCLGVLCLLMMVGIISLSIRYVSVKLENEQLKIRINNLSSSYNQSQNDLKQLQEKIHRTWCPEGWTRFGCSCYFKSSEEKTWPNSWSDCRDKGADLVTINSKEEQEFVTKLNVTGQFWIGLRTLYSQQTSTWDWKWMDKSQLREMFWATGHGNPTAWSFASCCDQQGKWTKGYYENKKTWICEI